ncbi:hypothetical protein [Novosphingopyxis baekryungensis]|uniref:hypothetical protein n=1 Tax=Novosphingopyxis baekryungensis TaxID=279369 RepID=UPI0012EC2D13|nr:hypothetical protein [Novosphingopyxis baekryungensis]
MPAHHHVAFCVSGAAGRRARHIPLAEFPALDSVTCVNLDRPGPTLLGIAARWMAALGLPLALAACGDRATKEQQGDALDAQLSGAANDPALNAALNGRILVDPDLGAQANRNALRAPPDAGSGMVPPDDGYEGDEVTAADLGGQPLMTAPKARAVADADCADCRAAPARTLGELAQRQALGSCTARLRYDAGWADRMPAAFPLYPKARLREAAGADGMGADGTACSLRVASFRSANPMPDLIDYYYSRARRAGYTAQHVAHDGDHMLRGARGPLAYHIRFTPRADGGTAVELLADGGR